MALDHFEVLGLDRDASPAAVKKAYFALAKKHHPDAGGDAQAFAAITEAFTVLSDDKRRADYLAWISSVERSDVIAAKQQKIEDDFARGRQKRLTASRKRKATWWQRLFGAKDR